MCGIAGIVGDTAEIREKQVQAMTDAIAHRGPDGDGIYSFGRCTLGHRRLSIIDLSTGDQPMLGAEGREAIVFNGEIYGYREIKTSLAGEYAFKTSSDTEVILALYDKYGTDLFEHLPGMFAIALWDDRKGQLLCGRDRFGEKPLYYAIGKGGEFVFASEIKAILASGLIQPVLSMDSLTHYLRHLYVHPHKTIYENVFTLPPAHFLTFRDGKISVKRYWRLPSTNDTVSLNEAAEKFRHLFRESVRKQLVADVPVGAFLSGGIDSSLVVGAAAEYKDRIRTISFGFGNQINELPYAKLVADKYSTDHLEIQQPMPDLGDLLIKMQTIYDEPFADSSNIPTYLISLAASRELKVVLTGDGGDELLGGYAFWYRHLIDIEKATHFEGYKKALLPYVARIAGKIGNGYFPFLSRQQSILAGVKDTSPQKIHAEQNNFFTNAQLSELGIDSASDRDDYSFAFENTVSDAMRMDIENYMPGDILVKTDRAAMANGLELRAPFLDKDLAEFCISLPHRLKLNYKEEKLVAKRAFRDMLPPVIAKRSKQGFGAPVTAWLQSPPLKELKSEYLQNRNRKIFQVIDFGTVKEMLKKDGYDTWILLTLALWMEKH
jgi:asparagine synthase (glutamine-hydrolysing)